MTYCLALKLNAGLVMLSDTRTNAGVDNVSRFGKMFSWEAPGERAICMMTAGNLSITQGVVTSIDKAIAAANAGEDRETILNAESMYRIAELFGEHMQAVQDRYRGALAAQGAAGDATLLVGGQRRGGEHRLFMVYSPGNFIEATADTPYFQIGEHKYGKPIIDRMVSLETPIVKAIQAAFVSMDSTLRSNLSVGMPLDLAVIRAESHRIDVRRRIEPEDREFAAISHAWSERLRDAFDELPGIAVE